MDNVNYTELLATAKGLLSGINYEISLLSNASSHLDSYLKNVNWVGFYLFKDKKLILGPFQGKVACLEIPLSKGVCGACASSLQTIVVDDVHKFPSHIACDSASNSEIVIPIMVNNTLYGVLDIDSINFNNFTDNDKDNLEKYCKIIEMELERLMKE